MPAVGEDEEKLAGRDIMHISCSPFASNLPMSALPCECLLTCRGLGCSCSTSNMSAFTLVTNRRVSRSIAEIWRAPTMLSP